MKSVFFTAGPSKLYPSVPGHIAEALAGDVPSLSHRGEAFQEIFKNTTEGLRKLLGIPPQYQIFFLGSATEAMERIIQNCVRTESFHYVSGAFSEKFYKSSLGLKKAANTADAKSMEGLHTAVPESAEIICYTQNETSAGCQVPVEELTRARKAHPDKLIAVDAVSSLPYVELPYGDIDAAFFSVQKGFGLPAGLGVLIVSSRAMERAAALAGEGINVSWYHSFGELLRYAEKNQTHETPNVLGIYLLGKVIKDMEVLGIERIRKLTNERALRLYAYFDKRNDIFTPGMKDVFLRSQTVATFEVKGGSAPVVASLKKDGIVIGAGYGKEKESHVRISNFPAHTDEDFERLFAALDRIR